MATFNVPSSPKVYELRLKEFLGNDFTTEVSDVDFRRSPDSLNMINVDGYLQKRYGYKILNLLLYKINGIWNVDTPNGDVIIVHAGTRLYEIDVDFKTFVEIKNGLSDNISSGIVFKGRLLILDGKRVLVYGKFAENTEVKYLDEIGYIPTTIISRSPNGGGTKYDSVNMIQKIRINSFLGTNNDLEYKLDAEDIDSTEVIVEKLNANGGFDILKENKDFKVDRTKASVTFTTAPGESLVEGRDNVLIRFGTRNVENMEQINKCTLLTTFGYNGNNNRVFITGNPKYPNIDWFCEMDNPLYFPADNVSAIGLDTSPIKSYLRVSNGKLAILKDNTDTEPTIYFRRSSMFNGKETFPIESGIMGVGCISSRATSSVQNDSLMLSNQGVYAVLPVTENNESAYVLRSYYANGKLTQEDNLKNAVSIYFDGKYYLAINGRVYIADTRYKTTEKDSKTSGYQYEWYLWDNIPVRVWFVWNNELYFGTDSGQICKFKNSKDNDLFIDSEVPVKAYWKTPMLYFNQLVMAKTIKGIILAHNPRVNSEIEIYYYEKKGRRNIVSKTFNVKGSTFPKILRIKAKAKKVMYIQIEMLSNNPMNMSFVELCIQYIISGKYRGE